ncbi:MAG: hypothetical protein EPO46_06505 [Lysobacter sp.]|nr:MAG: hypothetical protein EPO46_06505 [Lysobacter sp.]
MRLRSLRPALIATAALALAGCMGGPVKRVSEPTALIQQITVRADGRWNVELRLQNYSSIPMRFDTVALALEAAGQPAADVRATPALGIGPASADVVSVTLQPSVAAKLAVADALAMQRGIAYALKGTITATPEDKSARTFEIDRKGDLSPAPGLPGVLR